MPKFIRSFCLIAAIFCILSMQAAPAQPPSQIELISRVAASAMKTYHLKSLIVQVRVNQQNLFTGALGESMTGVPATPAMHFRNGAMAFTYMSTSLLEMVDRHKVRLDDTLSRFFPELPYSRQITLRNLANMTSGYADYVYTPEILRGTVLQPFRQWTSQELIQIGVSKPMMFKPGTNWGYCHTNYVILGRVLEKVTGMPLAKALDTYITKPMGLTQTRSYDTPQIPEPVLHSFSSERRQVLGVPSNMPFYEESTFWSPSWTTANGAVQITDITDMSRSMEAVGTGALLSPHSYRTQLGRDLLGFGHAVRGCAACRKNSGALNYGLGVLNAGPWIMQIKLFAGSGAVVGYLPSRKLTVSVVTTYLPGGFDKQGNVKDATPAIFASIANALQPGTVHLPKT
jgi:CubicO group peptidase (beta-lactamase class C family)